MNANSLDFFLLKEQMTLCFCVYRTCIDPFTFNSIQSGDCI